MNKIKKIIIFSTIFLFCSTAVAQVYLWRYRTHATDCTSLADPKERDLCYEQDDKTLYKYHDSAWNLVKTTGDLDLGSGNLTTTGNLTVSGGTVDLSGAATEIKMKPSAVSVIKFTESGRDWLNFTTHTVNDIAFGNTTDNPQTRFAGSGNVNMGGSLDVTGEIECASFEVESIMKITPIGGYAMVITNQTGGLTVEGELVVIHQSIENAIDLAGTGDARVVGALMQTNVPNGVPCWVAFGGTVEVKMDAAGCSTGDRIVMSTTTAGRGMADNTTPYVQEIGYARETVGANALAKVHMRLAPELIYVIPSGTTPAPNTVGGIFLDTDASANGDLVVYGNGAWRKVISLP